MSFPIPELALQQHLAILAKTGAGKTTTAKGVVEHVVREDGARVCILDPIKSDWWGLISSADGRTPGLPFNILGGPHGHVPVTAAAGKAVGELVGSGSLPLSIVDMADFEGGGIQRFFVDFAPALMKSMRGVLYLVLEEAHEFAPKERSGIGAENMAVHWAKKLATAGRSKGIRLIVVTHRVQSLHNAVLGSCDTLIVQRLTAPADQKPVSLWLKANASKEITAEVESSLSSMPTGSGWIVSGEAKVFERVKFPMISTFDNSKTPTKDDGSPQAVTSAPVDQAQLRALIGVAVEQAAADDPRALRARIKELEQRQPAPAPVTADAPSVKALTDAARREGYAAGAAEVRRRVLDFAGALAIEQGGTPNENPKAGQDERDDLGAKGDDGRPGTAGGAHPDQRPSELVSGARRHQGPSHRADEGEVVGALPGPQQKIVNAVAWWEAFGISSPSAHQVAYIAGYAMSGTWDTYRSRLRGAALIEVGSGQIRLTAAGRALATPPDIAPTAEALRAAVRAKLPGPLVKFFDVLVAAYPNSIARDEWASRAGYQQSGTADTYRSRVMSLDLAASPERGMVRAADWLFPK